MRKKPRIYNRESIVSSTNDSWNSHMQKNETWLLPFTLHKNESKIDWRFEYRSETKKIPRRKRRR